MVIIAQVNVVLWFQTYSWHKGVKYRNGKGSTASERLREIQFSIGIIVVILVQELNVAIVDQFWNYKWFSDDVPINLLQSFFNIPVIMGTLAP